MRPDAWDDGPRPAHWAHWWLKTGAAGLFQSAPNGFYTGRYFVIGRDGQPIKEIGAFNNLDEAKQHAELYAVLNP